MFAYDLLVILLPLPAGLLVDYYILPDCIFLSFYPLYVSGGMSIFGLYYLICE